MNGMGSWKVNVSVGSMPQKVATAVSEMNERLGVEFEPIAYLASQEVHGINHAVLLKERRILGQDLDMIVVTKFYECKDGITELGTDIVKVGGNGFGGTVIDVKTDIPQEAKEAFDKAFNGWTGSNIVPFALVATQITNGVNYTFAVELTSVTLEEAKKVALVTVNSNTGRVVGTFIDLLATKEEVVEDAQSVNKLGYAFTWLTKGV